MKNMFLSELSLFWIIVSRFAQSFNRLQAPRRRRRRRTGREKIAAHIAYAVKPEYNMAKSSKNKERSVVFAQLKSLGLYGMDAYVVDVEADISQGLPSFEIVGLPDAAVRESKDRVRSSMKNCGYSFPVSRITVNLAPADIKKEGPVYDLPMLLALLSATGQLAGSFGSFAFAGELSLSGEVKPLSGILPMAIKAKEQGFRGFFVPAGNAPEGAVVEGIDIYPVKTVDELVEHLRGGRQILPASPKQDAPRGAENAPDFSDVCGQLEARRALEIAAAGGHNILLVGPPGSGKSMLAKRLPSILPEMTFEESIQTTMIHSVAGTLPEDVPLIRTRPFRAPHHTVSSAGLSGGGRIPKPGEISLAHNGVLFLDELPEFSRDALEVLRQPLEDGVVTISRAAGTLSYPCSIMLVCAMNPCPCGYYGHPTRKCTCPPGAVAKYLSRISGPLLDRLDIHVEVPPVGFDQLNSGRGSESSAQIRGRVNAARLIQQERYRGTGITCNARLTPPMLHRYCALDGDAESLLRSAFDMMGLSARAYDRVLKVSRTIADLDGGGAIRTEHVAEAVQYRSLDRKYWQQG